jgi:cephalosporin-C deacetylase-like acetyl esterase
MKSFYKYLWVALSCCPFLLSAQCNFNALTWKQNLAYNSYLMRDVHQQYADRRDELAKAVQSKKAMLQYRDELQKRYKTILGDFPAKTALNAKVLKVSQENGFKVEKVIFESLPKRYVTANLYLPDGKGPFPASLELCGHGLSGKLYSEEAKLMALNGIAVLVVDPIGQGERVQLLDENGKAATRGVTTEHTLLNAGCELVGSSLAAYEWWDNHRAIDYLETRSDIDKNRLGVYGSSGGGTQTAYLIGLEDRLKVACICSYFSQRERVLELNGPSDGCQHISGEGKAHIEIADWGIMFAPKPLLIMSGLYDFVDYWGALQGTKELKQVYETLGAKDAVRQFTAESGHGMPKEKREALATWFRQWLCNDPTPVHETTLPRVPEEDQQCTATGQFNTAFTDAESIPAYNEKIASQMEKDRAAFLKQNDKAIRTKILSLLGIEMPKEKISVMPTGNMPLRTYSLLKYQILRKGEMPVPCVVVIPEKVAPQGKVILDLNEAGKDAVLNDENRLSNYVNQGDILVVADLRGYGEMEDPASLNDTKYWNREYRNAMTSLHIGRSIVGQRVTDILSLVDFLATDPKFTGHSIQLQANGTYGPVAAHAAFLEPHIVKTEITRSIKSYREFIRNPMQRDMFTNIIPGVLKYYDLKDLIEKAGKGRIQFID